MQTAARQAPTHRPGLHLPALRAILLAATLAAPLLLAACGQKGPLLRPPPAGPAASAASAP